MELGTQSHGVYGRAFIANGDQLHQGRERDPECRLLCAASVSGLTEARRLLAAARLSAIRTFQEQVWWKRWVLGGLRKGFWGSAREALQARRAALEPNTPTLHTYATHWVDTKPKVGWVQGHLRLDLVSLLPRFLGCFVPRKGHARLFGTLPSPSPPLHEHSWDADPT